MDKDTLIEMFIQSGSYSLEERHYLKETFNTHTDINIKIPLIEKKIVNQENNDQLYIILGQYLLAMNHIIKAIQCFTHASSINTKNAAPFFLLGQAYAMIEKFDEALENYKNVIKVNPLHPHVDSAVAQIKMPGPNYLHNLRDLHSWLQPSVYIEIGIRNGRSLAQALSSTKVIGIDPYPKITMNLNCSPKIISETSDSFFENYTLQELVQSETFDLAFIDGLHEFDQVLKDFINLEKYAHSNSIIVMHDVLPLDQRTSTRKQQTHFWTGDCWKIVPILSNYRADLNFFIVPTYPSGLLYISNLNNKNRVLSDNFEQAVNKMMPKNFTDYEHYCRDWNNIIVNSTNTIRQSLSQANVKPNLPMPKIG